MANFLLITELFAQNKKWNLNLSTEQRETRDERDERREELRRTALVPGGSRRGWLTASASVSARCAASGVQRTRSGGTPRVNRRKQPREAGKLRSRVSTVRGAEAAGRGSSFREQARATRAAACFHQRRHGADYGVVTN
ncbi:hypothetical protein NDU88_006078 [Pleurodeles waltl]|uniref:Uncharacterized protein n=1 Tax=Pleurodeles waltl TaxID=8319 RepID=A0AAV7TZ29_PLEWA|nr:hypothetical protein NDU88_006078 [Pleurodeles waltl]